jgi:hypothetical protein
MMIESCFSFRIYPKKGERFYFIVRVFKSKSAMRAYHDAMPLPEKVKPTEKFEAVTCPFIPDKDTESYLGEILFYRPMTGAGIVSHEMEHAALHWGRVTKLDLNLNDPDNPSEEILALAQGNLTRQFMMKY